jgi:hypothetical protein
LRVESSGNQEGISLVKIQNIFFKTFLLLAWLSYGPVP